MSTQSFAVSPEVADGQPLCVMVGSAGAQDVLPRLLVRIPRDCPLPLVLALHRAVSDDRQAETMLRRFCALPVRSVMDKDELVPGVLFLVPGGYHTLVDGSRLALSLDAPIAYARPSFDLLLESAAEAAGTGVLCVVLSGSGQDGARGAALVSAAGGRVLVQDPRQAGCGDMPTAAVARAHGARRMSVEEIGDYLAGLAKNK